MEVSGIDLALFPFELKALGGKIFPECHCHVHVLSKPQLCAHTMIQQLQLEQLKERQEVMTGEPEPSQTKVVDP